MNSFVSGVIDKVTTTVTENGDKTYSTSLNPLVDLFFQVGTLRSQQARAANLFAEAYEADRALALKLLFYVRDARGGLGERAIYYALMRWLASKNETDYRFALALTPEYGYWKDMAVFADEKFAGPRLSYDPVQRWADAISAGDRMASKYAPRDGSLANRIRGILGLTPRQYRKKLVAQSHTVETKMCAREWNDIAYPAVPSVAMRIYGKAFRRHDAERFTGFLEAVKNGTEKVNAGVLYPYELIRNTVDDATADAQWDNLPDYVQNSSFLPVIDVSGSMDQGCGIKGIQAMDLAISLGLYLMERNKSAFKDLGITFHTSPKFIKNVKGNLRTRFDHIRSADWGGSTDLRRTFDLIINHAKTYNVKQADMPENIIILSDMEFNMACRGSTSASSSYEYGKAAFAKAGYEMPNIIFWNMASRNGSTPVRADETGTALVSGASPAIMKSVLGGTIDPTTMMLSALNVERYSVVDKYMDHK